MSHDLTMQAAAGVNGQEVGPHVEAHVAMLIYRKENLTSLSGWTSIDLPEGTSDTDAEFAYIPLNGEQISFLPNNQPAGLHAPPLRDYLCPARMQNLRQQYQPPYSGAAAVINVPENGIKSCFTVTKIGSWRVDSEIELTMTGNTFVIATIDGTKSLTLEKTDLQKTRNTPIPVVIANVPARFLRPDHALHSSDPMEQVSHMNVYWSMGTGSGDCAHTLEEWLADNPEGDLCSVTDVPGTSRLRAGTNGSETPASLPSIEDVLSGANFECSNSQWP